MSKVTSGMLTLNVSMTDLNILHFFRPFNTKTTEMAKMANLEFFTEIFYISGTLLYLRYYVLYIAFYFVFCALYILLLHLTRIRFFSEVYKQKLVLFITLQMSFLFFSSSFLCRKFCTSVVGRSTVERN